MNGLPVATSLEFYVASRRSFPEGLEVAKIKDKWGYIDKAGGIVIKPQFTWACDYSEGLALVRIDGKYGYIDRSARYRLGACKVKGRTMVDPYPALSFAKTGSGIAPGDGGPPVPTENSIRAGFLESKPWLHRTWWTGVFSSGRTDIEFERSPISVRRARSNHPGAAGWIATSTAGVRRRAVRSGDADHLRGGRRRPGGRSAAGRPAGSAHPCPTTRESATGGSSMRYRQRWRRSARSFQMITWSRHSRRMEPITRSTNGLCQGDRGAVRTSSVPKLRIAWPNASP